MKKFKAIEDRELLWLAVHELLRRRDKEQQRIEHNPGVLLADAQDKIAKYHKQIEELERRILADINATSQRNGRMPA